jgi:hypothetical protein
MSIVSKITQRICFRSIEMKLDVRSAYHLSAANEKKNTSANGILSRVEYHRYID